MTEFRLVILCSWLFLATISDLNVFSRNDTYKPFETNYKKFLKGDTTKFVFNEDSLKYYQEQDILLLDEYFVSLYEDFDELMLMDSVNACFSIYNEYAENLGCNLLKLGIKKNMMTVYAELGSYLALDASCICTCDKYKGFLYLYNSARNESIIGLLSLATFYTYQEMYRTAEEILLKAVQLNSPAANFELYDLYSSGVLFGEPLLEIKFVDKEKAIKYLNEAVRLNHPYAMFEKGNRLLESNRDLAFKLYIKTYNSIKNELDYGALYGAVVSTLEREFKREWRKYIRKNNIKK